MTGNLSVCGRLVNASKGVTGMFFRSNGVSNNHSALELSLELQERLLDEDTTMSAGKPQSRMKGQINWLSWRCSADKNFNIPIVTKPLRSHTTKLFVRALMLKMNIVTGIKTGKM